MTDPAETRRLLRIAFCGDSVRGSLDGTDGPRPFFGWLELLAAIDALRTDAHAAAERTRPAPPCPRPRRTNQEEDRCR